MKRLLAFAAVVLLTGADPKNDPAKEDLRLLQGRWKITGDTFGGSPTHADYVASLNRTFYFKGDRFVESFAGTTREGSIEFRSGTNPRAADLVIDNGDGTKYVRKIILEVTSGSFRIGECVPKGCWLGADFVRPRSFDPSKQEAGQTLIVQSAIRPKS